MGVWFGLLGFLATAGDCAVLQPRWFRGGTGFLLLLDLIPASSIGRCLAGPVLHFYHHAARTCSAIDRQGSVATEAVRPAMHLLASVQGLQPAGTSAGMLTHETAPEQIKGRRQTEKRASMASPAALNPGCLLSIRPESLPFHRPLRPAVAVAVRRGSRFVAGRLRISHRLL